jgi:hypothetical protein
MAEATATKTAKVGRPKKKRQTCSVRYSIELAEMASAFAWAEDIDLATYLDTVSRDRITADFNALPSGIKKRAIGRKRRRLEKKTATATQ